jgi:hypothetical protein
VRFVAGGEAVEVMIGVKGWWGSWTRNCYGAGIWSVFLFVLILASFNNGCISSISGNMLILFV